MQARAFRKVCAGNPYGQSCPSNFKGLKKGPTTQPAHKTQIQPKIREPTLKRGAFFVFFDLFTGCKSKDSATFNFYIIVLIMCTLETYLYGWTHGSPTGEIHFTGSPVPATTLAHLANQSLI